MEDDYKEAERNAIYMTRKTKIDKKESENGNRSKVTKPTTTVNGNEIFKGLDIWLHISKWKVSAEKKSSEKLGLQSESQITTEHITEATWTLPKTLHTSSKYSLSQNLSFTASSSNIQE